MVPRQSHRVSRGARSAACCGVNIGKNATTPLDDAVDDYVACLRIVGAACRLRGDQCLVAEHAGPASPAARRNLDADPRSCCSRRRDRIVASAWIVHAAAGEGFAGLPTRTDLRDSRELLSSIGLDGMIATNTTVSRPSRTWRGRRATQEGGLSGAPLSPLALRAIAVLRGSRCFAADHRRRWYRSAAGRASMRCRRAPTCCRSTPA